MRPRFPWRWRAGLFSILAALTAGMLLWVVLSRVPDPLVEGRKMSEWAVTLLDERTNVYWPYAYSRKYREIFAKNQNSAIPHLIAAVRYPTDLDRLRIKTSRKLPAPISEWIKPHRRPFVRWVGLLALSDLARVQPDPRIPPFFLECMRDRHDPTLRKVAAYEAGPWLQPGDHSLAIEILHLALNDDSYMVRRDACRRIVESCNGKDPSFTSAAQVLRPVLEELGEKDPFLDVRNQAQAAEAQLRLFAVQPITALHESLPSVD